MKKQVVIIGGGVIGSSIAWRLARQGAAVTVLERGRLGKEASWASAGMIAPQAEAQAAGPFFQLCLRARDTFEATLEMLRADTDVDPEYDHEGILCLALNDLERSELEQRARWQAGAGGTVEELTLAAARQKEPAISPQAVYALYMPLERRVENRKLTLAYATAANSNSAAFVEGVTSPYSLMAASKGVYGEAAGEWTPADALGYSKMLALTGIFHKRAGQN